VKQQQQAAAAGILSPILEQAAASQAGRFVTPDVLRG
jgi:hypothetical protein